MANYLCLYQLDVSKPNTYGLALELLLCHSDYEHHEDMEYPDNFGITRSLIHKANDEIAFWVNVFPNPTKDFISIKLSKAPVSIKAVYRLTNSLGQIILSGTLSNSNYEYVVPTNDLQPGSYNLCIMDGDTIVHTQNIIVQ